MNYLEVLWNGTENDQEIKIKMTKIYLILKNIKNFLLGFTYSTFQRIRKVHKNIKKYGCLFLIKLIIIICLLITQSLFGWLFAGGALNYPYKESELYYNETEDCFRYAFDDKYQDFKVILRPSGANSIYFTVKALRRKDGCAGGVLETIHFRSRFPDTYMIEFKNKQRLSANDHSRLCFLLFYYEVLYPDDQEVSIHMIGDPLNLKLIKKGERF